MNVREVTLSLDECSEIRCLLKHKIDDINLKMSVISEDSTDLSDKSLSLFWNNKKNVLINIFEKLCSSDVKEIEPFNEN